MYSRTILLAAASHAVARMTDRANAARARTLHHQPWVACAQIFAGLHVHHYRLLSDPNFFRRHYVARSINPSDRVVSAEIDPQGGSLHG